MGGKHLTVLICTHNRAELLAHVLTSLNAASRPPDWRIDILVAANACTDETHAQLEAYQAQTVARNWLPLAWFAEPVPGKSHALNSALPRLQADLVFLEDDDQRVAEDFLVQLCRAADTHPEYAIFCGRLLPDWSGQEPGWIRNDGPYRIYPGPVPNYDLGSSARCLVEQDDLPSGGNLAMRAHVIQRVGQFSTSLGPRGHNLGGGEDTAYIKKAIALGEGIYYEPAMLQYHYVDPERLKLGFLLRLAYKRTFAVMRMGQSIGFIPRYVWRKLATHLAASLFTLRPDKRRFHLIRAAATLGEIRGFSERMSPRALGARGEPKGNAGLTLRIAFAPLLALVGLLLGGQPEWAGLLGILGVASLWVLLLLVQSLRHFSRTGPHLQAEIMAHNVSYSIYALSRLALWAWLVSVAMGFAGVAFYQSLAASLPFPLTPQAQALFAALGIALITGLQFCRHLLFIPGSIEASSNYRTSRFFGLWALLTPRRIGWAQGLLVAGFLLAALTGAWALFQAGQTSSALGLALMDAAVLLHFLIWRSPGEPAAVISTGTAEQPNILLIGVDSLRHDRLGGKRDLTPNLDNLARRGIQLTRCFVPCARTAPSLASLLCSRWPHVHGIRDNFATAAEADLGPTPLPGFLASHGYRTLAISDWCGSDLGKFPFGFETVDLPEDQWNIRYLLRQGPKDLRLFLSLFTHNDFGHRFLPELYFLAGIPMTRKLGRATRRAISELARDGDRPFFANVFISSTHGPFGSEYPYYTRYTDPDYRGDSKFVMGGLNEPFEVVHRQGQGKAHFDFDQILNLYDGCVKAFDDELKRILDHLAACGLDQNTIVAVYSDHGMEFFERETWGQGNSVIIDEGARIPFVLYDPRLAGGKQIDAVTRSIDIAPTLLDLVGLPIPAQMQGVSLRAALDDPQAVPDLAAYSETGVWFTRVPSLEPEHIAYPDLPDLLEIPDKNLGTITIKRSWKRLVIEAKDRMLCTALWKLVRQPMRHGVEYKLFDLSADPACLHDVATAHPEILEGLRRKLEAMVAEDPALREDRTNS